MNRGIIFSDIDGTLCFHQDVHGIREIGRNSNGIVFVEDPAIGKKYKAYDISASSYTVYIDEETQRLGKKIQEQFEFVFVTGGRSSTIQSRNKYMSFADGYILENGGLILDSDLQINMDWNDRLEPERKCLVEIAYYLKREGWILDDEGRTSAIKVRKKDNPQKSRIEFEKLKAELELPTELKKTSNIGNLDIILNSAGKGKAVQYWLDNSDYKVSQSIGIGDDINDIDFLRITRNSFVLSSSFPEVIKLARKKGWYISKGKHFDGINEIMKVLLSYKNSNK